MQNSLLPLDKDSSNKFIPWLVSLLMFLSIMMGVAALSAHLVTKNWQQDADHTFTVELPTLESELKQQQRLNKVLQLLESLPGVAKFKIVERKKIMELMTPWVGKTATDELPLPILIDGETSRDHSLDFSSLQEQLNLIYPGVVLESHEDWHKSLKHFLDSVEFSLLLILLFIAFTVWGCAHFATKTGLKLYQDVINVLQLVGAEDTFIAKQFQTYTLKMGVKASFIGISLSALTVMGLYMFLPAVDFILVFENKEWFLYGGLFLIIPLFIIGSMILSARRTVMRVMRTRVPQ